MSLVRQGIVTLLFLLGAPVHALTVMEDSELDSVTGQALFVADNITGSGVAAGFNYTRIGLDVDLALNANMNKMQLGCGGFNESIKSGCDIDMDYVSLMGRSATIGGTAVTGNTAGNEPAAVGSDFLLSRPYIEIATKGTGAAKEVVGIKIGAQSANGYFGVGRTYAQGQTNLENGGTCNGTQGNGALACHSGINNISGFLHTNMAAKLDVSIIGSTSEACFGQLPGSACSGSAKLYKDFSGTRMSSVYAGSIQLTLTGGIGGLIGSGYAQMDENLRFVHGFSLVNTQDFFLSFQREKVYYPTYATNSATAAGSQVYSARANAGWWMNVPDVNLVAPNAASTSISLLNVFSALSAPGYLVTNLELNQAPPSNCYGSSKFC